MKKKLTKTISLIVFAMFLQLFITNVHAASGDIALTCEYDDPKETVILNITNSGSISKAKSCTWNGKVKNWSSADSKGFKGRDYYLENHECPPYAVYDSDKGFDDVFLARDEDNADDIADANDGWVFHTRVIKLKSQTVGVDASDDVRKVLEEKGTIQKLNLPKTCQCSDSYDGVNISVSFDVAKNYSEPDKVTIKFGTHEDKEYIENYGSRYDQLLYDEKSDFYYLKYLLETDSCPDYAIVARRGIGSSSYFVLVSDEENLSDLKKDATHFWGGKTYTAKCTEKKKTPTSNSNSNSSSKSNSNKKSYEDPDVNSNVVRTLTYDVSTYSCGNEYLTGIPVRIPKLGKFIMNFLQILIPIILIIYGSLDLLKAVYGSKEDDIKKAQQTFVKRLTSSILIFFVFAIVKLVVSVVSRYNSPIMECVDCILRDSDSCYEEE